MKPDTPLDDLMGQHPDESVLLDFSAGALGVAEADALVIHLDACSRCRQLLSMLTRSDGREPQGADDPASPANEATRVGFDALIGSMLGEYRVLERINQGGMGVLYRGEQPVIGKAVAIKVLLPEIAADPNLVGRLVGEARAVNSIRHPNIIDIFSLGQLPDGRHYMVMELLEGLSLSDMLRERGRLQPPEVIGILEQSMSALQAAHAAGVIHRDLKPENIFVNPRADGWRVTLLDFGLAKQAGAMSQLTAPNVVLGTPGYMAPEQIRGQVATTAIDIYAMGIVAWTLLAGREPYSGGSIVEVMKRQLDAPVPLTRAHVPGVPVGLDALIVRMMAKDPAARPTADEVRKIATRLKNDPRRYSQSQELTQLVSGENATALLSPSGATPRDEHLVPGQLTAEQLPPGEMTSPPNESPILTPDQVPITLPEGVGAVPAAPTRALAPTEPLRLKAMKAAGALPQTIREGSKAVRAEPGTLTTRPARGPSRTTSDTPVFVAPASFPKTPLIIAAIGLALSGGAIGLWAFNPASPPAAPEAHVAPPEPVPDPLAEVSARPLSRGDVERSLASSRTRLMALGPGPVRKAALSQLGRLEERLKKNEAPATVALALEKLLRENRL